MSERFELLDIEGDISGKLRLIYGSGPADPAPFGLALTPQYVARASQPYCAKPKKQWQRAAFWVTSRNFSTACM
jgi:hypothetical protein